MVIYAPPTPSPGETTTAPPPATHTTAPMTQLPTTGPSGPAGNAWGVLVVGLVLLVVGLAVVAFARRRRERTT